MLVIVRFDPPEDPAAFQAQARDALGALARCRGFQHGWFARSVDEPETWSLVTTWESVGAYRRALSSYDVKVTATPFMYLARDEVTAFEELLVAGRDGGGAVEVKEHLGDLAPGSATTAIGDFGPRPER